MTILVIAEHDNASLKAATLNTVAAAAKIGGDVHVLVAGHNAQGAADAAAKVAGVAKVLLADAPQLAAGLAENVEATVLNIAKNYSHILAPATAYGKNIAPRIAAKLDVAQISDITAVDSADTFERPIYAGNAIATVQSSDPVKVITVRSTGFDPVAAEGGSAAVEKIEAAADSGLSQFVSREVTKLDRPELTSASIIVSGGRGLGSGENYTKVLEPLADKLNAALGRLARRSGCRLCAERLPGRSDRQDRGAATVRRGGHLGCDPASGRHEGLEGNRRDQQGPGSADFQRRRLWSGGRSVHGGT
jgi:electron transfer flavoprotein alpha subunit